MLAAFVRESTRMTPWLKHAANVSARCGGSDFRGFSARCGRVRYDAVAALLRRQDTNVVGREEEGRTDGRELGLMFSDGIGGMLLEGDLLAGADSTLNRFEMRACKGEKQRRDAPTGEMLGAGLSDGLAGMQLEVDLRTRTKLREHHVDIRQGGRRVREDVGLLPLRDPQQVAREHLGVDVRLVRGRRRGRWLHGAACAGNGEVEDERDAVGRLSGCAWREA